MAGMFAGVARDFVHPELILAGLVWALTRNNYLVAIIPIINKLGALGPQLLVSSLLEHSPRRRPYFILLTVVRTAAHMALVFSVWLLTRQVSPWTLTTFFGAYALLCLTNGGGHIIFMDMVGRLIAPDRVGAFLGMRRVLGGILAIVTGYYVIHPILSKVGAPTNYMILAAIGTVMAAIDMSIWCQCREEPGAKADRKTSIPEALSRGWNWVRNDHNYRCYLWQRLAFRLCYLGLAFFIPYGTRELKYESAVGGMAILGGIFVATDKISRIGGAAFWAKIADWRGSRITLAGAGLFMLLAPLLALVSPHVPSLFEIPIPGVERGVDLPLLIFIVALICMGFGLQATFLGGQRFLITAAPSHRRASYIAFLNTITSPLTLLPLAGAWVAETLGMPTLFAVVAFGGLMALVAALRMTHTAGQTNDYQEGAE